MTGERAPKPPRSSAMPSRSARRCTRTALPLATSLALVAMAPFVAEGIYTREQAERGRARYGDSCAQCHGAQLEGGTSVPLAGEQFIRGWSRPDLTLDDFYYIVRRTMPKATPGSLTREAYTDIVAHILQQNGFPPGAKELRPDPALLKAVRFGAPAPPAPPSTLPPPR